jgi:4-hydroxybenzoate polyprenyltransferase
MAVALVGGTAPARAIGLGLAMTLLQFAIGTLNDLVDEPLDAGRKPHKPLPAGLVSRRVAGGVAVAAAAGGVILSGLMAAPGASLATAGLAVVVLAIGAAYDLRAKGTAWSWLPFAVGIPLLPVFGWYGGTGGLPDWFAALVPLAALAGAALAIANARADMERDLDAGVTSIPVRLGLGLAWTVHAGMWLVVVAGGLGWLLRAGVASERMIPVLLGAAALGVAVLIGREGGPARREWAWQLEAIAAGIVAAAWIGAASSVG